MAPRGTILRGVVISRSTLLPSVNFQDSGIARGFASLADAFAPNPQNVMRAALMGAQRQQAIARAGVYDASAAQAAVQTGALRSLPDVMAGVLGPEASPDQVARARAMGVIAQAPGGLQHGPAFATGAMTFANPAWRDPAALSATMTATGVQTYGNTPAGHQDGLSSAERVAAAQNASREQIAVAGNTSWAQQRQREAEIDAQTRRTIATEGNQAWRDVEAAKLQAPGTVLGGRPRVVGSGELQRMSENMKARLAARYNVKPDSLDVDQDVQSAMRDAAARVFQETGNAEAAIEAGVSAVATRFQGASWLPWGARARVGREPAGSAAAPTTAPAPPQSLGAVMAPTPAPAGSPAAATPPGQQQFGQAFTQALAKRFNMWPQDLQIPPDVSSVLEARAAEAFRRTGSMDAAVAEAISQTPLRLRNNAIIAEPNRGPATEPWAASWGPLGMIPSWALGRSGPVSIAPGAIPLPPGSQSLREGQVVRRRGDGKLFTRRDNWLFPMDN